MKTFKKFSAWSPASLPIRVRPLGQSDSRFLIYWRILQHAATFWKGPNYKWSKNDSIWFCHVSNSVACLPLLPCPPDDITVFLTVLTVATCRVFTACFQRLAPAAMRQWKGLVKSSMNQLYGHDDVTTILDCHVVVSLAVFLIIFLTSFPKFFCFFFFYFCILLCRSDSTREKNDCVGVCIWSQSNFNTFPRYFFLNTFCVFPSAQMQFCLCRKKKTNLILGRTNPDGLLHLRRWTSHFRTSHSFSRHADANEV